MAIKFVSQVPSIDITSALDPTSEAITWMSYQLTEWANRCGEDYVKVLNNHEQWDAYHSGTVTRNDYNFTTLELRGPDWRNDPTVPCGAVAFRCNYDSVYVYINSNKTTRHSSYNYWNFEKQNSNISGSNTGNRLSYFSSQIRSSHVLWCDTPGRRFFSFDYLNSTCSFAIVEALPLNMENARKTDFGWAGLDNNYIRSICNYEGDTDIYYPAKSYWDHYASATYGSPKDSPWLRAGGIVVNALGAVMGKVSSNVLYQTNASPAYHAFTNDTVTLFSMDNNYLFNITGEELA